MSDKDRAAWSGTIKKELSYWVPSWMSSAGADSGETVRRPDGSMVPIRSNGIDLKEGQAEMLLRELEPNIRARQFGDPGKAVTGALAQARQQGKLSVLGGYAVFNRGAKAGSVEQELVSRGMPPDKINDTFSELLESKLAANGMSGTPFVVRSQGADLSFIVFAEGGQFPITGKQIEDAYRTRKADKAVTSRPPEAHRPGFGKQVGYRGKQVVIEDGN